MSENIAEPKNSIIQLYPVDSTHTSKRVLSMRIRKIILSFIAHFWITNTNERKPWCAFSTRVLLLILLISFNLHSFSQDNTNSWPTEGRNYSDTTTVWSRDQIDTLIKDIRAWFDELLDVEVGMAALQARHISNVGYGLDNVIGSNGELRDTFAMLRDIVQSEFFIKSAVHFDHFYTRLLNRKKYSPNDNELNRQFGGELYAGQIYFDVIFYPAWDTLKLTVDQARKANQIAWSCRIDVSNKGTFTAEFSESEMDTLMQAYVAGKNYGNIKREAAPEVNQSLFAGLGWLSEKFGFKPYENPTNIKRVDFSAPMALGYDEYDNKGILFSNYDNIAIDGKQYYVPWKSVQVNDNVPHYIFALVRRKENSKPVGDTLQFFKTTGETVPGVVQVDDSTYKIQVPNAAVEGEFGIAARYSYADSTGKEIVMQAGQVNIAGYPELVKDLVIVPVITDNAPIGVDSIQRYLDRIYGQAAVDWRVTIAKGFRYDEAFADGSLDDGSSGVFSNYTSEMNDLIDAFKDFYGSSYDKNKSYLFLVEKPKSGSKCGFMPLTRRFGFIFTDQCTSELAHTIAHELGHGPFHLYHTFSTENDFTQGQGSTDNLMDYSGVNANNLYKYQWDYIHNPQRMIGLLQDDDEGESATVTNIEVLYKNYKNTDGSLTFLTPSGKPITIKEKINWVKFVTYENDDKWEYDKEFLPMGTLCSFQLTDGREFIAAGKKNSRFFYGYINGEEYYKDKSSKNKSYSYVLAGIPKYEKGKTLFSIYPTNYIEKLPYKANVDDINLGDGDEIREFEIASYLKDEYVDVYAKNHQEFSLGELYFLQEISKGGTLRGRDAVYAFKTAYYIRLMPSLNLCLSDVRSSLSDQSHSTEELLQEIYHSADFNPADKTKIGTKPDFGILAGLEEEIQEDEKVEYEQDLYYKNLFYTILSFYEMTLESQEIDIEGRLSKIIDFFGDKSFEGRLCLMRQLPLNVRCKILKKHSTWTFTPKKEIMMADIIATTPSEQQDNLLDTLKANNYELFWSLYKDLSGSNRDQFIAMISAILYDKNDIGKLTVEFKSVTLSEVLAPEDFKEEQTKYIIICRDEYFDLGDCTIDDKYEVEHTGFNEKKGNVELDYNLTKDALGILWEREKEYVFSGHPFEFVRVLFLSDYRFSKCNKTIDEKTLAEFADGPIDLENNLIKKGYEAIVPAAWVYHILNQQNNVENFTVIRIIGDGIAIAVAVASANPGPILIAEAILAGGDIVFSLFDEYTANNPDKAISEFSEVWDSFYEKWYIGVLGVGSIKAVASGRIFRINKAKIKTNIYALKKNAPKMLDQFIIDLAELIKSTSNSLANIKNGSEFLRPYLISVHLEASILQKSFNIDETVSCIIRNSDEVVISSSQAGGLFAKVATASEVNGLIRLEEIRWYNSVEHGKDITPVMQLNDVAYLDNVDDIKDAVRNIEVVETSTGQFYLRPLVGSTDAISDALRSRILNTLSKNQADELIAELGKNSDLKAAMEANQEFVEGWRVLDDLGETALKTDPVWLKKVSDWDGAGVKLSKNGDNLKLADASGNALGEFKNGKLLPVKYDFDPSIGKHSNGGSPIGEPSNGYQVYKHGDNLSVRRVPDRSPYNPTELTNLTQHPRAHVLERHGHDVTDDALIKRANRPSIAPDGKRVNNPPPYSSKFNTSDNLKDALNNTLPGTDAFRNGVRQGNTIKVTYTASDFIGKGVARNTSSFVDMKKALAIYEDLGNGTYQLVTMYPIP